MRNLWRTTASLIRQYPILWLPVILAEVFIFNLRWFERIFRHWLIQKLSLRLSEGHSVLSNSPVYSEPTQHVMNQVIVLAAPIEWCARYLSDVIFACALIATAAILHSIAETGIGNLRAASSSIAAYRRRILIYSLKIFGLDIVSGSLGSFLSVWAFQLQHSWEAATSASLKFQIDIENLNLPTTLPSLLLAIGVAFIIAPIAVRLIQPSDSATDQNQTNRARLAATITAIAVFALRIPMSNLATLFQRLSPTSNWAPYSLLDHDFPHHRHPLGPPLHRSLPHCQPRFSLQHFVRGRRDQLPTRIKRLNYSFAVPTARPSRCLT